MLGEPSAKTGFRAEACVRPSPIATNGKVLKYGFDLKSFTFTMSLDARNPVAEDYPTEIYLPEYHFDQSAMTVEASSGKWVVDIDRFEGGIMQVLRWWHGVGEQSITVQGVKRRQGFDIGFNDDVGYLEQYRRSLCSVM